MFWLLFAFLKNKQTTPNNNKKHKQKINDQPQSKTTTKENQIYRDIFAIFHKSGRKNTPFLPQVSVIVTTNTVHVTQNMFLKNPSFTFVLSMCFIKIWGNCGSSGLQNRRNKTTTGSYFKFKTIGHLSQYRTHLPQISCYLLLHHLLLQDSSRPSLSLV